MFSQEQKQYLEGFAAGSSLQATWAATLGVAATAKPSDLPSDPNHNAQSAALAAGKKLTNEETAKRTLGNGLDIWDQIVAHARSEKYPKGTDVFLFKFHGLFYVGPAQDSFMCRLRIPGGQITSHQLAGVADLADTCAAGHCDVTTRANLQVRQIPAAKTVDFLLGLSDLGLVSRGSGADNVRNITCSPTAGIDPEELIDTLPLAREIHHHILNHRELYGLPRKFNIAFDGGGAVSSLEDTNDIGFVAARHTATGQIYFHLTIGGITGHKDFARHTGIVCLPSETTSISQAILLAFIEHGDRTDRKKARLKYVLDRMGFDGFLKEVERHYGKPLTRTSADQFDPRPPLRPHYHLGVHPQKQPSRCYIGVLLPVGRLTSAQMRGLANVAANYGSGKLRLTVWQNLLIPDIADHDIPAVKNVLVDLGLHWLASTFRAGLVACTGSAGCKYGNADTKKNALELAAALEKKLDLDTPLNIHLTGCHHSCAQHYIGDIGLIATKVGEEAREGYHLFVGGGFGLSQNIGAELARNVLAEDLPRYVETLLRNFQERRAPGESFQSFILRHTPDQLRLLVPSLEPVPA